MEFYGLIGEKLGHSLSEPIHRMFFELMGIQGAYKLVEVPKDQLPGLGAAMRLIGIRGMNVTIPYKQAIMDQLDRVDEMARRVGAVNTVLLKEGELTGYNTDVYGLRALMDRHKMPIQGATAAILGTGGVSKAALEVLLSGGAQIIYYVSRDKTGKRAPDSRVICADYRDLADLSGDILINCTPVGMYPKAGVSPVGREIIARFDHLVDTIYNPMETEFLRMGREMGKNTCNGLYMLVAQAMAAQAIWQGEPVPEAVTERIYHRLKDDMEPARRVFIIGMMGCGKTTLGKALAGRMNLDFVDMDDEIERMSGHSIPDLFAQGEAVFREWESKVCEGLSLRKNLVVATGGGAPLYERNLRAMKANGGLVLYNDRPVERIAQDIDMSGRPMLAGGMARLYELAKERAPRYARAADLTVLNDAGPEEALEKMVAALKGAWKA